MTPTIYLLRHGETEFNRQGRLQGSECDSPLTDLGRAQAARCAGILAQTLDGARPRFVSSPAGRAQATLWIILAGLGLPPVHETDADLREVDLGLVAGLTGDEVLSRFPEVVGAIQKTRAPDEAPPGGETDLGLEARAARWLASVDRDTVAVSHRSIGRFIRARAAGLDAAARAALDEPHDCVFRIRGTEVETLAG